MSLDFIVLGVAKAGTTTLYYYLKQHPRIELPTPKETWFFDGPNYEKGMDYYYSSYFKIRKKDAVLGEIATSYLYVPYVAKRIYKVNPNIKLIAILRDPVSRAISDWWMLYSRGIEDLSFEDAIKENIKRIESGIDFSIPEEWYEHLRFIQEHRKLLYRTYIDYGYYEIQLNRYLKLFQPRSLLVIQFEQFVQNPKNTLKKICNFIGIEPITFKKQPPRNVAFPSRRIGRLISMFGDLGLTKMIPQNMKNLLLGYFVNKKQYLKIDPGVKKWLVGHYKKHNLRLANIVPIDLSLWSCR